MYRTVDYVLAVEVSAKIKFSYQKPRYFGSTTYTEKYLLPCRIVKLKYNKKALAEFKPMPRRLLANVSRAR